MCALCNGISTERLKGVCTVQWCIPTERLKGVFTVQWYNRMERLKGACTVQWYSNGKVKGCVLSNGIPMERLKGVNCGFLVRNSGGSCKN